MTNYREKMREYLKEPNEYSSQYGKWGALNSEQRQLIKRLLNEMDGADVVIKKQYEEKQQLISFLKDKISLCDKDIKEFSKNYNIYFRIVEDTRMCKRTYQDVLDFVRGGKE